MYKQVKTFSEDGIISLDSKINNWISERIHENVNYKVIDIGFYVIGNALYGYVIYEVV